MSSTELVALSLTAAAAPLVKTAAALEKQPQPAGLAQLDLASLAVVDGPLALSRAAVDEEKGSALNSPAGQVITRAGLALDADAVFADARRRIENVFRLNVALLAALALILLIGIGGAIYSGLFLHSNVWPLVFGGVTVVDLAGVYVLKPVAAINRALLATQQIDLLYLRLREGLKDCESLPDPKAFIECRNAVWDRVWADLSALSAIS